MATAKKKSTSRAKPQSKAQAKVKPAASANQAWAQQSAKLYPFAQFNGKSAEDASAAATKQMQDAAEQMMKYGSDFMQQMFSSPAVNGAKGFAFKNGAQDSFSKAAREGAEKLSKGAGSAQRSMNDVVELGRENAEAIVEASNIAVGVSKQISAEVVNYVNKAFSNNVDLSKQAFTCRTLNDMFDLNNKFVKSNLDAFFNESVKVSEMLFQCATDISEPLNERVSETSQRLSKAFAA
jgi:hypothetical protein